MINGGSLRGTNRYFEFNYSLPHDNPYLSIKWNELRIPPFASEDFNASTRRFLSKSDGRKMDETDSLSEGTSDQKNFGTVLLVFLAFGIILTAWMFHRWKKFGTCTNSDESDDYEGTNPEETDGKSPDEENTQSDPPLPMNPNINVRKFNQRVDSMPNGSSRHKPIHNRAFSSDDDNRGHSMPSATSGRELIRDRAYSSDDRSRRHLQKMQRQYSNIRTRVMADEENKFTKFSMKMWKKDHREEQLPENHVEAEGSSEISNRRILKVSSSRQWKLKEIEEEVKIKKNSEKKEKEEQIISATRQDLNLQKGGGVHDDDGSQLI
eukprot:CAMPEP_0194286506 /NCGR_PEP_ID=MMETSP0169-20130528/32697_1 /TAXON_ID=218684 /ORGANISM="Corethron pennatum, Strain L29A3" /LENGTH=321 /DNA_ID=CAMNT_0039032973 /DNA_START=78 /DNA_END=1043 /DNA_ORIENTATION=+